ncbi:energy transducer TonB family protein [Mesorhizobium sp. L-8-3]|uniref:energy transducer TonB family protein n=1 Tax=Mesorhizobium sp. L-8-3 TaxID=2744522 RepID=UPI0019261F43|nr:energy transducer TonB [Mesorhizobium sp. L-8-3]BCH22613.1 protein TonB [Mesorhizobium sp. L-8-3]
MSIAASAPSTQLMRLTRRDAMLWGAAGAMVLAIHIAIGFGAHMLRPADSDGGPPPALMIELAPLPVAPAVQEDAFVPDQVPAEQADPVEETQEVSELEPEPIEETEPVEEVQEKPAEAVEEVELAKVEPVEQQEPLDEVIPDVVEAETPEVAVPLPEPRPVIEEEKAEKPVEKPRPQKKEKAEKKEPAAKPTMAAKVEAPTAPRAAAQKSTQGVSSPRVSPAKWHSRVVAWLKRHQRYPSRAKARGEQGTVRVAFTVDPGGRVTSSRVTRSSGNPELDKAALDMLRRASPVPAPPKELAKASIPLALPVTFDLR